MVDARWTSRRLPAPGAPAGAEIGAVRRLFLRIVDSGIPAEMQAADPDTVRRARIILSFTLVLILLGVEAVVFFAWALSAQAAQRVEIALVVGLLLTLAVPVSFRRIGSLELGANLVIAGSFVVIFTSFTVVGGVQAPLLHWCALMPMLAALMGARTSTWAWAAIGFGTIAFFVAADAAGWQFSDELGLSQLQGSVLWVQRFVDVGSWLGILLAVALLYEAHKEEQTSRLAAKNAELESEMEQRGRAEERNRYLAYYDELTALPNRRLFEEQLASAMKRAQRSDRLVGVLFLDLDGFKQVNDAYGHSTGDRLLQHVAGRLRRSLRMADSLARGGPERSGVVSRLGGDEFTMLLVGIRDHREAAIVARRILASFEEPFDLGDHEVYISASIGIALDPGSVEGLEDLLRNADLAMYHAKEKGKNTFQFFEESMNADVVRRSELVSALRRALDREEFDLHFQPIVDAHSLRVVAVEALARWNHPEWGSIPAAEFIKIAEDSGSIAQIGDWVVREACRRYDEVCGGCPAPLRIAVNVSSPQFRRGRIVETVRQAVSEFDLDPRCLELEVSEKLVMIDEEEASRCLEELRGLGVRIALDDFGTGFSSLSHVKCLPVDSLKIDRSFVAELESDRGAQAITMAIISLAHQLGMRVVGEGVETEAQERFLQQHGCDELQGDRFGRPAPAEAIARTLAGQARKMASELE